MIQFLATLAILYQNDMKKGRNSSYSSTRPFAKLLARQGIEAILSHKKQRRPLPSLLYKSFFYDHTFRELVVLLTEQLEDFLLSATIVKSTTPVKQNIHTYRKP